MDGNRHLFYMLAQEDKETRRGEEDKNHRLAAHAGTKDFNVSATIGASYVEGVRWKNAPTLTWVLPLFALMLESLDHLAA